MYFGYARVSKSDGSQRLDPQVDELIKFGVSPENVHTDMVSGARSERDGLNLCLRLLRKGDTLIVWKLDRLGRSLKDLLRIIEELSKREIGFKVLTNAQIDTTTAQGRMLFGLFGVLAEFERELIRERTRAGLAASRKRGKLGGRPYKLTKNQLRFACAAMQIKETVPSDLCRELNISSQTLYNLMTPNGELREAGRKLLGIKQ
jgi:DNA invertase Pin-like site-specific DNA recombinase